MNLDGSQKLWIKTFRVWSYLIQLSCWSTGVTTLRWLIFKLSETTLHCNVQTIWWNWGVLGVEPKHVPFEDLVLCTSCTPKFSDIPLALHIDQLLSLFLQLKQNRPEAKCTKTFHLPKKNKTTHHICQVDSLCPLTIVWKCEFKRLVEMVCFWIFIKGCSVNLSLNNQFDFMNLTWPSRPQKWYILQNFC